MMLPDCMMPDGADPCRGYHELRAENEQLKAYAKHERSLGAEGPMIELVSARQEIERLKMTLGPGATEAWEYMHDEIERLEAAIAYVRQRSQRACEILNEFDNTRAALGK